MRLTEMRRWAIEVDLSDDWNVYATGDDGEKLENVKVGYITRAGSGPRPIGQPIQFAAYCWDRIDPRNSDAYRHIGTYATVKEALIDIEWAWDYLVPTLRHPQP